MRAADCKELAEEAEGLLRQDQKSAPKRTLLEEYGLLEADHGVGQGHDGHQNAVAKES